MPNVLVVGATGHIGRHIVDGCLARGMTVHALVRGETLRTDDAAKRQLLDRFRAQRVVIHEGSITDATHACTGIEIVVSAVTGEQIGQQEALLDAAKAAGTVRRFIPSEHGIDTVATSPGRSTLVDMKREMQGHVVGSGLPYTFIYANGFATFWAASLGQLGLFAPPPEIIDVYGGGSVKAAITTPEDIGRYIARVMVDPRAENRHVAIQPPDNVVSQNDMIAHWESKIGTSLARRPVSAATLDAQIATGTGVDLLYTELVRSVWIDGSLVTHRDGVLDVSVLYPDILYTRVTEFLDGLVA